MLDDLVDVVFCKLKTSVSRCQTIWLLLGLLSFFVADSVIRYVLEVLFVRRDFQEFFVDALCLTSSWYRRHAVR